MLLALAAAMVEGWIINPAALIHPGKASAGATGIDKLRKLSLSRFQKGRP
jgi:hypothetical protein